MKGRVTILLSLTILAVLLTGCWSRRELNTLSIAVAMGIDKSEEGYLVTVQIINPSEAASQSAASSGMTAIASYRTTGSTIFEALRRLTQESPRKIYLSHCRVLVFGEDIAREGIAKALDFISRDHEFRTDFYIVVAKDARATDVLNILTPLEKIPANKIYDTIESSKESWASTYSVQLDELINKLVSDGNNPVLTGILIQGNSKEGEKLSSIEQIQPSTILEIEGLAAFNKDKLVGWLDPIESSGFNHIVGKVKNTVIVIPWKDEGKISIEIIRTDQSLKGKVEDEIPKINIDYFLEANVGEVEADVDLSKVEEIYEIEKVLENEIKKQMSKSIDKAQKELRSDIFGFGEVIHRSDPKSWKNLKEDWDKTFQDLQVSIKVDTKIRRTGTITKPFQKEAGE